MTFTVAFSFNALMLLFWQQDSYPACKKTCCGKPWKFSFGDMV